MLLINEFNKNNNPANNFTSVNLRFLSNSKAQVYGLESLSCEEKLTIVEQKRVDI